MQGRQRNIVTKGRPNLHQRNVVVSKRANPFSEKGAEKKESEESHNFKYLQHVENTYNITGSNIFEFENSGKPANCFFGELQALNRDFANEYDHKYEKSPPRDIIDAKEKEFARIAFQETVKDEIDFLKKRGINPDPEIVRKSILRSIRKVDKYGVSADLK